MLAELLYPLQEGYTPLHLAARRGHTTCVEHLLSTPGINVNIRDEVSTCRSIERDMTNKVMNYTHMAPK